MKFKSLMKKINLKTKIEIYDEDNYFVNKGTAKEIQKMYAWLYFLKDREVKEIEINSKVLIIIIERDPLKNIGEPTNDRKIKEQSRTND